MVFADRRIADELLDLPIEEREYISRSSFGGKLGKAVSEPHALVERTRSGLVLRHLSSTNETFVNGRTVTNECLLADQDVIRLGHSLLVVELRRHEASVAELSHGWKLHAALDAVGKRVFSDDPLLIEGETGTGKEVVARSVHHRQRPAGPFVAINLAGLAPQLAEVELFGARPGAFTGATNRQGLFAAADHGTLLLDELGFAPLEIQRLLLRVLQERTIRRVGDDRARPIDVRVIAATSRDIGALVRRGLFLEDLRQRFWPLLKLPPLRERRVDILRLARARWQKRNEGDLLVSAEAAEALLLYRFGGNVRQLQSCFDTLPRPSDGIFTSRDLLSFLDEIKHEEEWPDRPSSDRAHHEVLRELIAHGIRDPHVLSRIARVDVRTARKYLAENSQIEATRRSTTIKSPVPSTRKDGV